MQTLQQTPMTDVEPARHMSLALGASLGLAVVLLVAAGLLWMKYGTAVFFETIAAGIAACF